MSGELAWYLKHSETWMAEGICVGVPDPDLFFPNTEGDTRIPLAKTVCFHCPVEKECLEFAIESFQVGIWGGTTDAERTEIRGQRRALSHS